MARREASRHTTARSIGIPLLTDVTTTIQSLIANFPADEQDRICLHLADTLRTVIAQRLLPCADGNDRVLIAELLLMHPGVRDVLRDPGRLHEMRTMLAEGRAQFGTQTFDQHLADLVIDGRVAFEDYVQVSAAPRTSRIA